MLTLNLFQGKHPGQMFVPYDAGDGIWDWIPRGFATRNDVFKDWIPRGFATRNDVFKNWIPRGFATRNDAFGV